MGSAEPNSDELQTEVARLRAALDSCEAATRDAEATNGELRGQIAEMRVQLSRARQAQEWAESGGPTVFERIEHRWADASGVARRLAEALRRRLRRAERTN